MTRPAYLDINLDAIKHNLNRVQECAPASKVVAMVKADAYGHGLEQASKVLSGVDAFGVCCLEEAIQIRRVDQTTPVILIEGVFSEDELHQVVEYNFEIVIHKEEQLKLIEQIEFDAQIKVWLKVDTGMHRLGIPPDNTKLFWQRLVACKNVHPDIILMTHFADADNLQKPMTAQQQKIFAHTTKFIDAPTSLANSAAILAHPTTHADWVRPGIMLYGISPFADKTASDWQLQPAMTLSSELIEIRKCKKGDAIGYGGTWICPEDMPMGVIAIGYGDGYPRHAKNGTPVVVNGVTVPLAGSVSMDMITVDLRLCPKAKVGDKAILWGADNPIEIVAKHSDTIAYELACHMTKRLSRQYSSNA